MATPIRRTVQVLGQKQGLLARLVLGTPRCAASFSDKSPSKDAPKPAAAAKETTKAPAQAPPKAAAKPPPPPPKAAAKPPPPPPKSVATPPPPPPKAAAKPPPPPPKAAAKPPPPPPKAAAKPPPPAEEPFDNTTYKAKEYYNYNETSFYDIENDMSKFRIQQPSSLK